jgi:hypothetical protein
LCLLLSALLLCFYDAFRGRLTPTFRAVGVPSAARSLPSLRDAARAWATRGEWYYASHFADNAPYLPYQAVSIASGNGERYTDGCGPGKDREDVLRLRWRFNGSSSPQLPRFPVWDRDAACAVLRGSTVVVLGDSMSGEFYDALVSSLWDPGEPRRFRVPWVRVCGDTVNVTMMFATFGFPGSSQTALVREANAAPGARVFPFPNEIGDDPLRFTVDAAYSAAAASPGSRFFVVLNRGAWMDNLGADAPVDTINAVHVAQVTAFVKAVRAAVPRARIFWRTTNVGHPLCQHTRTASPLAAPPSAAEYALADKTEDSFYKAKNRWDNVFAQNDATVAALPDFVSVVDVAPATALRRDSHPLFKYDKKQRPDCLHYCLPGPIDTWVLLWTAMLRYEQRPWQRAFFDAAPE